MPCFVRSSHCSRLSHRSYTNSKEALINPRGLINKTHACMHTACVSCIRSRTALSLCTYLCWRSLHHPGTLAPAAAREEHTLILGQRLQQKVCNQFRVQQLKCTSYEQHGRQTHILTSHYSSLSLGLFHTNSYNGKRANPKFPGNSGWFRRARRRSRCWDRVTEKQIQFSNRSPVCE